MRLDRIGHSREIGAELINRLEVEVRIIGHFWTAPRNSVVSWAQKVFWPFYSLPTDIRQVIADILYL